MTSTRARSDQVLSWAVLVGMAAVLGPLFLWAAKHYQHILPKVPRAGTVLLGMMIVPPLVAGLILGASFAKAGLKPTAAIPFVLGIVSTVPGLVRAVLTIGADVARDPTSHNLWPFELALVLFAGGGIPLAIGAGIGIGLASGRGRKASPEPDSPLP